MSEQALYPLQLPEGFELKPFKPSAIYIKGLDCLVYLARDCSYVATLTSNPLVEHCIDKGELVGFKVWSFLTLTPQERTAVLATIEMDHDEIKNIEDVWIHNANEQDADMSAGEAEFLDWLKTQRKPN